MLRLDQIKITPALLQRISRIDQFKARWATLAGATQQLHFLRKATPQQKKFRQLFEHLESAPITEDLLAQLNATVTGQKGKPDYRAKTFPVVVQDGDNILGSVDTAAPDEITVFLPKLLDWLNGALNDPDAHPLLTIGLFGAVIMMISPYERGNGRLMRLLTGLIMHRAGYIYTPFALLDQPRREMAERYYAALTSVRESLDEGRADWQNWLDYFFTTLDMQVEALEAKLSPDMPDTDGMPALSLEVLKLFNDHDRLQMKDIEKLTGGKRATLKLRLGELVEGGYLTRRGKARSTWYSLT